MKRKKYTFHHKPLWQKACIVAAGPLANFLLAIIILTFLFYGKTNPSSEIGRVLPDSAAAVSGLQAGDVITFINDNKIRKFSDISRVVKQNKAAPLEVIFMRDSTEHSAMVSPEVVEVTDPLGNAIEIGRLGIEAAMSDPLNFIGAFETASYETYIISVSILVALGEMVVGKRGVEELGGPLKIAQYSGQASKKGAVVLFWLIALLSISLGLINLFPIPMLDGGHLLYYIIEVLQGKPLAEKYQEYGFRLGLIVLIMLFVFVTFNDLRSLVWNS